MLPISCTALIVAAGRGERFGGSLPKQYLPLGGEPVIRRTVRAFLDHPAIGQVLTVIAPEHLDLYQDAMAGLGPVPFVDGGMSRQASVLAGLAALEGDPPDLVLIHDAARPLVEPGLIDDVLAALASSEAVLPALPIVDSLRRVDGDHVVGEAPRDSIVRAQTPQGFRFGTILSAHRRFAAEFATDDVELVRRAGGRVLWVDGQETNIKITRPSDLDLAARLLPPLPRRHATGMGHDIHRTEAGRPLVLGGVAIPSGFGLAGHSDADVVLHALTDAILGTIGAGDIGVHFPPSDEQWRGAASCRFVTHALTLLHERQGRLEHVDVTLMAERPKIAPHRAAIVARLAELLELAPERIGLKAGTMEGLDAVGRGEAIEAHALATVSFAE